LGTQDEDKQNKKHNVICVWQHYKHGELDRDETCLFLYYIEEGQTTQWPKEKGQKDKQRFTKHRHKTKDRVTRTLLKPGMNACVPEG
jgi:hypothetical protein